MLKAPPSTISRRHGFQIMLKSKFSGIYVYLYLTISSSCIYEMLIFKRFQLIETSETWLCPFSEALLTGFQIYQSFKISWLFLQFLFFSFLLFVLFVLWFYCVTTNQRKMINSVCIFRLGICKPQLKICTFISSNVTLLYLAPKLK